MTAWQEVDLAYIRAVMGWEIPQINSAGIFPSVEQVELFAEQLKRTLVDGEEPDVAKAGAEGTESAEGAKGSEGLGPELGAVPGSSEGQALALRPKSVSLRDQTRLSSLLERFVELAQMDGRYFLCDHDDMATVANWLHSIPLSLADTFTFANAPVNTRDTLAMTMLYQFAATYASLRPVALNVRLTRSR